MSKMRTFAGNKPLTTIYAQCAVAGVAVDDFNFRKRGAGYVAFGPKAGLRPDDTPLVLATARGAVMFNTFNGRFHGANESGEHFSSDSTEHEDESWFQALLSFFYAEEGAPAASRSSTTVDYTLGGVALLATHDSVTPNV